MSQSTFYTGYNQQGIPTLPVLNYGDQTNTDILKSLQFGSQSTPEVQTPNIFTQNNGVTSAFGLGNSGLNIGTGTTPELQKAYTNLLNKQAEQIGAFNWSDAVGLGLSAFNTLGQYQANRMNKKAIEAQIGNLAQNQARRTNFENKTASAFA